MTTLKNKIKRFLEKETQAKIKGASENLIDRGILDSFSMIKIINFLEKELGVSIDMEKLSPDNFNSVNTIAETAKKFQK